ncbi:hypothetical protein [Salipaludibacillus keqinensis]|nr:hypothetical protein [Salipaludibacillus keqinensis]
MSQVVIYYDAIADLYDLTGILYNAMKILYALADHEIKRGILEFL